MKIKIEKDLKMNLGSTSVENIFIDSFMPWADGNFVKIYLLGLRRAREDEEVNNKILADLLGVIENDIVRAWDYWEEMGIIKREDDSIVFLNLKKLFVENVYFAKTEEKKDLVETMTNPIIADMLSKVEFLMRRTISPMDKQDLASWIEIYNMPPQIILEAFKYACERQNVYKIKYVEKIIRTWSEKNIRSMEAVEEAFRAHDEKYYRYNEVMRTIGLGSKPFTDADFELVNKWFDLFLFDMDLVKEALKRVVNIDKPNLNYFDSILSSWHKKGITRPEEIELFDKKEAQEKENFRKTKFHNFEGHTKDLSRNEMEEMVKKKRDLLLKQIEEGNE